jgi:hypothetical protein
MSRIGEVCVSAGAPRPLWWGSNFIVNYESDFISKSPANAARLEIPPAAYRNFTMGIPKRKTEI